MSSSSAPSSSTPPSSSSSSSDRTRLQYWLVRLPTFVAQSLNDYAKLEHKREIESGGRESETPAPALPPGACCLHHANIPPTRPEIRICRKKLSRLPQTSASQEKSIRPLSSSPSNPSHTDPDIFLDLPPSMTSTPYGPIPYRYLFKKRQPPYALLFTEPEDRELYEKKQAEKKAKKEAAEGGDKKKKRGGDAMDIESTNAADPTKPALEVCVLASQVTESAHVSVEPSDMRIYSEFVKNRTNKALTKDVFVMNSDENEAGANNSYSQSIMIRDEIIRARTETDQRSKKEDKEDKEAKERRYRSADPESVKRIVIHALIEKTALSLKELLEITNQPQSFLKTLLADLCVYNKEGQFQYKYTLKSGHHH